jgi:hypothetical protein
MRTRILILNLLSPRTDSGTFCWLECQDRNAEMFISTWLYDFTFVEQETMCLRTRSQSTVMLVHAQPTQKTQGQGDTMNVQVEALQEEIERRRLPPDLLE